MALPTIAIIGRPNVGKSTLFNRLTKTSHALVDDQPGVTRDRREGKAQIGDFFFTIIDTPGLEEAEEGALENRMMLQTKAAIEEADVSLMVIDARAGVTSIDQFFANWLRKFDKPVVVVANKCEGGHGESGYFDSMQLGFDHHVGISAAHNDGIIDLYDTFLPLLPEVEADNENGDKAMQIAIIGRPNAGKSTFLNGLLETERLLTGPEAGITRDAIAIDWRYKDTKIRLIDTAGLRRKSHVKEKLEKLSTSDSLRAIRYAHVVVMVMDATIPLEKQDLALCELVVKEGRAIVLALNKWDLVKDKDKLMADLRYFVDRNLTHMLSVPLVPLSAAKGENLEDVIECCLDMYTIWNKRFPTAKVNQWLQDATAAHAPPLGKNKRRIRIKYITQGNTRPPTFTVFCNRPEDVPESYKRYLINGLRERFGLRGVPIRLMLRTTTNPYRHQRNKKT